MRAGTCVCVCVRAKSRARESLVNYDNTFFFSRYRTHVYITAPGDLFTLAGCLTREIMTALRHHHALDWFSILKDRNCRPLGSEGVHDYTYLPLTLSFYERVSHSPGERWKADRKVFLNREFIRFESGTMYFIICEGWKDIITYLQILGILVGPGKNLKILHYRLTVETCVIFLWGKNFKLPPE